MVDTPPGVHKVCVVKIPGVVAGTFLAPVDEGGKEGKKGRRKKKKGERRGEEL